jgi:hypothetical protein
LHQVEDYGNVYHVVAAKLQALELAPGVYPPVELRWQGGISAPVKQDIQLLRDRREYERDNVDYPLYQAEKAALHVLVVFSAQAVEDVEEFDLGVYDGHPTEVLLEEEQEGQEGLASDDYRVMLQETHKAGKEPVTLNGLVC